MESNSLQLTRPKRQAFTDPKAHHDATIAYLISAIPYQVENAVAITEMSQRFKVFKRVTQGWAIVIGSWFDIYSDFVINNRSLGNFGTFTNIYIYGGKGFYGVGFGFPLLLGLPEDTLKCGPSDFLKTLDEYKMRNGLNDLFASDLPISAVKSIVGEFDIWVRAKLACILDFEAEIKEAAEIGFSLDELNAAINLRINIEEEEREEAAQNEATTNSYYRRSDLDYQKKKTKKKLLKKKLRSGFDTKIKPLSLLTDNKLY